MAYKVKTQDVDGSSTKKYASLKGAVKRFEEMVGYSVDAAIAEQFFEVVNAGNPPPKIEDISRLYAVSNYGTAVTLFRVD